MSDEGPGRSGNSLVELRNAPSGFYLSWPLRREWLDLHQEDPIEPRLPIVDAQHHLLTEKNFRYPGMPFGIEEFSDEIRGSGHNIVATVYVETRYKYRTEGPEELWPVGEVEQVTPMFEKLEADPKSVQIGRAIVAHADLLLGDGVGPVLDALVEAGRGRVTGIRDVLAWDPDDQIRFHPPAGAPKDMMGDPRFQQGFRHLATHDLAFNAIVFHPQLGDLEALARANPNVRIVIDHVGMPVRFRRFEQRKAEVDAEWRNSLAALAKLPNTYMKIGVLSTIRMGLLDIRGLPRPQTSDDLASEWKPYFDTCIELFGPSRCMLESDYTVVMPACKYGTLWNAFKKLSKHLSEDERAQLFAGTAQRFYKIDNVM